MPATSAPATAQYNIVRKERELLQRATEAIVDVYKGVGTPGDFGYESREGRALNALYNVNNEIVAHLNGAQAEG